MYLLFWISANNSYMFYFYNDSHDCMSLWFKYQRSRNILFNNVPDLGFLFFCSLSYRIRVFYSPELQKPGFTPEGTNLIDYYPSK